MVVHKLLTYQSYNLAVVHSSPQRQREGPTIGTAQGSKPNVLFIICDDLNTAIGGLDRQPAAAAPNIQRLMREGVCFTQAHSNCPICLPSRNSLFSGIYPHRTGHFTLWDNWRTTTPINTTQYRGDTWGQALLGNTVMMPKHFKDHGYQVYGAGKTLHQGETDSSWWTEYAYGPVYGPALPFGVLTDWQKEMYEGEPLASYIRRYEGLDRFFLTKDQFTCHVETAIGSLGEIFGGRQLEWKDPNRAFRYISDDDRDLLPDEKVRNWGIEILQREHTQPFLLALGFMKPHAPWNAPQKYHDMFPLDSLELPPFLAGDLADCALAHVQNFPYGFLLYDLVTKAGEMGWRKWLQAYLACIAFVDEQIGLVLDALENSPYKDNTVVVFTSDNGFHMGEKQYLCKNTLWEESTHVPLIIKAPGVGKPNSVCERPVSLIDLYPTLIDLCGLPEQPNTATHRFNLDGRSLRSLLADPERGEWDGPDVVLSSVRGNTGIHHSVRSQLYRYTLCGNGEEELYDHRCDPYEWHNLAGNPQYNEVKAALRQRLLQLLYPEPGRE